MNSKIKYIATIFIAILCLSSCNSDKFRIEGNINDVGTQNIRVIYTSGSDLKSTWVPVIDGKFEVEGSSPELTVVNLFNQQKGIIAHVVAKNGDDIEIEGSIKNPFKIAIKGTDLNEKWNEFVIEHAEAFKKGNGTMIDIDIEKYIRNNKGSIVSTLLLMNDYSNLADTKTVKKLLNMIEESARPSQLLIPYTGFHEELRSANAKKKLLSFALYSKADSIETFKTKGSKTSLLYFWIPENGDRKEMIKKMKAINKKYGKAKLQITDITLENDSAIWKKEIKTDSVSWKQFWGLGGKMNNAIHAMDVKNAPYFIVLDSIGTQLYRGNSFDNASKTIDKKLK
ncbi:MAG: DUF4369 domain-containing protein [Muribaculaceae bacterium]